MIRRVAAMLLSAGLLAPAFVPAVAAEPGANPRFAEVEKQLDRDGDVYVYLNTRPFVSYVSGLVAKGVDFGLKMAETNAPPEELAKVKAGLGLAGTVVRDLGLNQLGDFGLSVRPTGDGLFRTKYFLAKNKADDNGLLWRLVPANGDALPGLALMGKDTVVASATRLNFGPFWAGVKELIAKTPLAEPFTKGLADAKSSGVDIESIIASIGDEFVFALALDETRKLDFPPVGEIPEPSLLVALKVKDRTIPAMLTVFSAGIKDMVSQTNLTDKVSATVITPPQAPPQVLPVWAEHDGWLLLGSHPDVLRRAVARLAGGEPGLAASAEFQRYAKGLPVKGTSLTFMSTRLMDTYTTVLTSITSLAPPSPGAPPPEALQGFVKDFMEAMRDQFGMVAVSQNTGDGVLTTSQGAYNYAISVGGMAMILPAAVGAAVVLPAFASRTMRAEVEQSFPELEGSTEPEAPMEEAAPPALDLEPPPPLETEPAPEAPAEPELTPAEKAAQAKAEHKVCKENLRVINKAAQRYMIDNKSSSVPHPSVLLRFLPDQAFPECPSGGTYYLPDGKFGLPRCDHPGHTFN